jgi:hypothetical protein
MAANNLVAAVDGVLVKVGKTIVSLYQGGEVPEGADERHVKHLTDLGLLVEADEDVDIDEDAKKAPAKSTAKAT